jgi:hypothetical protein
MRVVQMTNEIIKTIVEYLNSNGINAVGNEATNELAYPYAVVTMSRLNRNDNISLWSLEVNVWDKHKYYSRAETISDNIDKLLDFARLKSGDNLICIFESQKNNLKDTDPAIKRVNMRFDMNIYESEN